MTKRIAPQLNKFRYQDQQLKFNLAVLVLIGFCAFIIVMATFTQFEFKHIIIPLDFFSYFGANFKDPKVAEHFLKYYRYIPQIPAIMFIVALLGRKFGLVSVLLYIIIGLFFAPVFALGGGIDYVFKYGFGYILGYIPAMFFAGSILRSGLTYRNMAQATLVGVITIHLIGVLYMLFIATFQKADFHLICGWIIAQSGTKIIYDLIIGFVAMSIAKVTKKLLWFAIG